MTYLKQAGIILMISFAGELIKSSISFPIPASIYGFLILFLLLQTGTLKENNVSSAGSFLVEIMPVMFIPGATGIVNTWFDIRANYNLVMNESSNY